LHAGASLVDRFREADNIARLDYRTNNDRAELSAPGARGATSWGGAIETPNIAQLLVADF